MPEKLNNEIREVLGAVRSQFEYLTELGFETVVAPPAEEQLAACPIGMVHTTVPCRHESLKGVADDLGDCRRCGLNEGRNQLVFGVGNPNARLLLVGEAPGREEDLKGEPFVGEAGKLLDRILFAIGLQRSDVYICNVLKCRPPQNRDPQPEEVATCEPFLVRQIAAIQPRVVVALGRFAVQSLLQSKVPIGRLRGEWHQYHGVPLMPTYHPAYLLRNPQGKQDVWEDMKAVRKLLNKLET